MNQNTTNVGVSVGSFTVMLKLQDGMVMAADCTCDTESTVQEVATNALVDDVTVMDESDDACIHIMQAAASVYEHYDTSHCKIL